MMNEEEYGDPTYCLYSPRFDRYYGRGMALVAEDDLFESEVCILYSEDIYGLEDWTYNPDPDEYDTGYGNKEFLREVYGVGPTDWSVVPIVDGVADFTTAWVMVPDSRREEWM